MEIETAALVVSCLSLAVSCATLAVIVIGGKKAEKMLTDAQVTAQQKLTKLREAIGEL